MAGRLLPPGQRFRQPADFGLELVGNRGEGAGDVGAEGAESADDEHGNQGSDQRVFNCGDGALVGFKGEHGTNILCEHFRYPFD